MNKFITSCILCAVLFTTPVAVLVFQKTVTLEDERRKITFFPDVPKKIRAHEIKQFFREFDFFFADHFPLRGSFLSFFAWWNEAFSDNLDMNKCYRGKDNWLFLGNNYTRCVDKLQGRIVISDKTLQHQTEYYTKMRDLAKKSNAGFVIFIGPNKSTIYPEFLPPLVTPNPKRFITPLIENLRNAGMTVYDPTERLLRKKNDGLLYYRTDTHWNRRGAYEAFEGFREYVNLPAFPLPSFETGLEPRGDLVDIGGFKHFPLSKDSATGPIWDPPLPHAASDKTAWIFGDSFAGALSIYMEATFIEMKSFPHNEFKKRMSSTNKKPDIIIWVIVERNFGHMD